MSNLSVAKEILSQLGGSRFIAMTGARDLLGSEAQRSLSFRLPRGFAMHGINRVTIALDPSDTYTVETIKVTKGREGYKAMTISKKESVYADQLQGMFTAMTGLDTHL